MTTKALSRHNSGNPSIVLIAILLVFILAALGLYWFLTRSFLVLSVTPKDAIVTIDNAPIGLSSLGKTRRIVQPGLHSIRVEADGYISYFEKIDFRRSQQRKVNVALQGVTHAVEVAKEGSFLAKGNEFNSIHYLADNGTRLYKDTLTLDENNLFKIKSHLPMTEPRLSGIREIIWSPSKELALFRKEDAIYLFDFKKYDFINQTETLWGKNIGSIAWSPDNSKIAYYYEPGNGEKSLIFSNIANTEITRVFNFAETKIENPLLRWSPDSEWLLIVGRSASNFDNNKIYLFNSYSRVIKEVTDIGSQIDGLFSPDNNKILYSTYSRDASNPIRSSLSVMNKDGEEKRTINLRAEINKTVWKKDNQKLIVASYNDKNNQESLFTFDTVTKEKTDFALNSIEQGYINTLLLSDDERFVIYQTKDGVFGLKVE